MKQIITLLFLCTSLCFSQDFWEQSNGPYGGTVTQIAFNSNDDIFVGTTMGIYRSIDNGESWVRLNIRQDNLMVSSIEIDTEDNLYVVLSNEKVFYGEWSGNCIYRSLDNGDTWDNIFNSTSDEQYITSEIISNSKDNILFGTLDGYIYRSVDKGEKWTKSKSGLQAGHVECLAINSDGELFAGMFQLASHPDNCIGGIYSSKDNGNSWSIIETNLKSNIWPMCIEIKTDGTMLVETNGNIYRSADNGQNWDLINNNLPEPRIHSMAINKDGDIFVGPFNSSVYWSSSNGESWDKLSNGLTEETVVWSLGTNSKGELFAGTEDQGIFRLSGSQENWVEINNGLSSLNIYFLGKDHHGKIYSGTNGGVFTSVNNGTSWTKLLYDFGFIDPYADGGIFAVDPSGIVYLGNLNTIYSSKDNGSTWSEINYDGLPTCGREGSSHVCGLWSSLKIQSNADLFLRRVGMGSELYRSSDGGDNWVEIFSESYPECYAVGLNDYVFVGCEDIYRSSNSGDSFEKIEVSSDKIYTNIGINSEGTIFAFAQDDSQNYLFTSTDNGDNWSDKSNFLPNWYFVNCLYFDNDDNIFVGTYRNGIYFSTDNGNSWSSITEGLPKLDSVFVNITSILIDLDGYIYAGTEGNSVYKTINPIVSSSENLTLSISYNLSQNYPNPFNPSTTIQYSIPKQSSVTLKVYDILGSAVLTLVNASQPQGNYEVEFDGAVLTSGIYFYRLQAGDFVEIKKMILLK